LDLKKLPDVLETAKGILYPLVSWLDKPIFPEPKFLNYPVPKEFRRKRGVRLFESGAINIWLQRSGMWFLRFYNSGSPQSIFREVDSEQLAEVLLLYSDVFLNQSLRGRKILGEISFLKDVALYDVLVLRLLSQFFEAVKRLLKEREERLRLMSEWLNLLDDFNHSLDPLTGQGKEVSIKEYSIFGEDQHGYHRCTENYLCPEALEPSWEALKNRYSTSSEYKEFVSEHRITSLKDFLQWLGWIFEEIEHARSKGEMDAASLFGRSTGRLELAEDEIAVLKELVASIGLTVAV